MTQENNKTAFHEDTPYMVARREKMIKALLPKARPGNSAWRRIEALQGYDGDFVPGRDDGEPPQGAKW